MDIIDGLWHLLNFFAPAFGLGLLAASATKLAWRSSLKSVGWLRLSVWAVSACVLALLTGLVVTGADGKMSTYAGMVLACTASLWWCAFGPRRA